MSKKVMKCLGLGSSITGSTLFSAIQVFASNTYVENGAKWFLDGIFWIIIVMGVWGVAKNLVQRNVTGVVTIVLMTAFGTVLCKNPEILVNLGNTLKGILNL